MSSMTATSTSGVALRPTRAGHASVVGAMCAAVAGLMAMVGLGAAYLAGRYGSGIEFAKQSPMKFNNYSAVVIVCTLAMASLAAGWGVMAARLGNRRWGATGFGLALLFDLAALNLLWAIVDGMTFPVGDSGYSTITHTLLVAAGIAIVIGAVSSIAGLVLTFGGHASPTTRYQALAVSIGQHFAGLAWIVPFLAIFLKK